jgi:hypothetical protein
MKNRSDKPKNKKSKQIPRIRGVSVSDLVLPWDSKDEFERLHRDLTTEFSPHGRMEQDTVLDLAIMRWRKYQLAKWRRTAALKDPFFIELMESGRKSWSGIRKYLLEQDQDGKTIRGNLSNLFSELAGAVKKELAQDQEGMEKEEFEGREQRVSDITKAMSEHLIPMLQAIDAGPSAEKTFEQACSPESLERLLKCEAAIDSRIDKLLARLVHLKEYKPLYGAHAPVLPKIESPGTAAELEDFTSDH